MSNIYQQHRLNVSTSRQNGPAPLPSPHHQTGGWPFDSGPQPGLSWTVLLRLFFPPNDPCHVVRNCILLVLAFSGLLLPPLVTSLALIGGLEIVKNAHRYFPEPRVTSAQIPRIFHLLSYSHLRSCNQDIFGTFCLMLICR